MVAAGLLVLSLFTLALGRPTLESRGLHIRSKKEVPQGFSYLKKADAETTLSLRLALVQNNATGLEQALYDVSNPLSDNYGHHLTKAEVEALVAPSPQSVEKVTAWLSENGITPQTLSPAGDWLGIEVPISKANALLNADFNVYTWDETNATSIRTLAYAVPAALTEHLAFVFPSTQFIPPAARGVPVFEVADLPITRRHRSRSKRATVPDQCDQQITPECILGLYNIPTDPATADGNNLFVSGFLDEIANKDDLTQFMQVLRPDSPQGDFNIAAIDGGITDTDAPGTIEASLDIQYTVGIATEVPTNFVSVGNRNQDGDLGGFLDIINALLQLDDPPLVLTTSFGFNENAFVDDTDLASTLCTAYGQLGARGTSILFASGDGGVSGPQASNACNGREFVPTFPSGCPFLTSVGSTRRIEEEAAPFSSGGFSNIFARPAYQDNAVAGYLEQLGDTNAGLFEARGRGFPDVSAQGVNFVVNLAGRGQGVSGTSASSPVFASVVALLNDARLNAGQSPLGFLNPLLYSTGAAALIDITKGSNPGCGTDGFPALEGWDPVTGLGTPDFAKLLALVADGNGDAAQAGDNAAKGNATETATSTSTDTTNAESTTTGRATTTTDEKSTATDTEETTSSTASNAKSTNARNRHKAAEDAQATNARTTATSEDDVSTAARITTTSSDAESTSTSTNTRNHMATNDDKSTATQNNDTSSHTRFTASAHRTASTSTSDAEASTAAAERKATKGDSESTTSTTQSTSTSMNTSDFVAETLKRNASTVKPPSSSTRVSTTRTSTSDFVAETLRKRHH